MQGSAIWEISRSYWAKCAFLIRLHHVVSFVECVKGLSQHATNNSRLVGAQRELELYLVLAPELSQVVPKGLSQRLAELSQVVPKGLSQRLAECQKTL